MVKVSNTSIQVTLTSWRFGEGKEKEGELFHWWK